MRLYTKIKAFTITEMVIVIIISTIVAGLAFTVLSVVQRNMVSIESNYEKKTRLLQLEQSLTIDFNRYIHAYWNLEQEQLVFKSPLGESTYQFYADSIVTGLETFQLQLYEKHLYFKGEKVKMGDIDAIKLNFSKSDDFHRIFVFKYDDPTKNFDN